MKTLLLILSFFIAITAILLGLLMATDPQGEITQLSPALLQGTPFRDFMIPGILLAAVVGGVNILAVFYNMQRNVNRYNWAMAGGLILTVWIVMQMIMIEAENWLHFLYLGVGLLVVLISYQLKGKWAA